MNDHEVDQLIHDLSAPMFIYRMSKPVVDNPDIYSDRIVKGANTKVTKAREEIVEVVCRFVRERSE